MAKDPAFLFYSSDFLTGTMFMTNEQVGIYVRILCAQHQHGGILDKVSFLSMVGTHEIVKKKFIETEEGFFNERLMVEMEKRSHKSASLSANAKVRWNKEKQKHCKRNAKASKKHIPIENENENVIDIINDNGIVYYRKFAHLKLTIEEYDKLIASGLTKYQIDGYCDSIENYKKNVNYTSLYLTILSWKKKDEKKSEENKSVSQRTYPKM